MSPVSTRDFPELSGLFATYLNQDFVDTYGSVDAALRAYRAETDAGRRARARAELQRLIALAQPHDLAGDVAALGCDVYLANAGDARAFADRVRDVLG